MDGKEFNKILKTEMSRLFSDSRKTDEFAFLFAILGINSGVEDAGWQPIAETTQLVHDLIGLINAPINEHTQARLALLLYCHITEANYLYHVIYNLLLTVEGATPKLFNFFDKYRKGAPPSVITKIAEIKTKASELGYHDILCILNHMIQSDIRNAFFHSDYILFNDELRLKHRGSEIRKIPLQEVMTLTKKTTDFFYMMGQMLTEAQQSFPKNYRITGRKSKDGHNLQSVEVIVDENGYATGFHSSEPLPLWGNY